MANNFFYNLNKAYLIAEIGVNHNGSMDLAKEMILSAKESGADAVKFQTFKAELLVATGTPKVEYQKETTKSNESHFDMLKKLELTDDDHVVLFDFCRSNKINFLSTPYDIESAKFLKKLGVNLFKTASADIVDHSLHEFIAATGIPSIIATGMATMKEIEDVIKIYNKENNSNFILLHCVSNYPCSDSALNMNAINSIKEKFNCPIGYSDHSIGNLASILSISYGAKLIEKHFTLDKTLPGPDHKASSTPEEFKELVSDIRRAEKCLVARIKKCKKKSSKCHKFREKVFFYQRI